MYINTSDSDSSESFIAALLFIFLVLPCLVFILNNGFSLITDILALIQNRREKSQLMARMRSARH